MSAIKVIFEILKEAMQKKGKGEKGNSPHLNATTITL
ncbi:hypothetical protein MGA3_01580 [Bacillus methanolicus MGA3]|nr:hypothetical protein MGA3_01580 [Bacillus methanolicus MGA3]